MLDTENTIATLKLSASFLQHYSLSTDYSERMLAHVQCQKVSKYCCLFVFLKRRVKLIIHMVKGEQITDSTVVCLLSIHLFKMQETNEAELSFSVLIVYFVLC